jgi:hypothetical protein
MSMMSATIPRDANGADVQAARFTRSSGQKVDTCSNNWARERTKKTLKMLTKMLAQLDEVHSALTLPARDSKTSAVPTPSTATWSSPRPTEPSSPTRIPNAGSILGKTCCGEKWFERRQEPRRKRLRDRTSVAIPSRSRATRWPSARRYAKGSPFPRSAIGTLGAFFDLEEEANIILNDYMPAAKTETPKRMVLVLYQHLGEGCRLERSRRCPQARYAQLPPNIAI